MADVDNAGPVKPTNKICWFNFSSYLFSTSNSSQQTLQGSAQVSSETPKSSPARRRSSPRFNNAGNISQQADYPSSCNPTSSCCLTKDSCSKCCSPSKLLGSKMKKNSTLSSINNASGKKQRSPQQYCLDESEDFPTSQAAAATPQNHHSYLDHGHCMQNLTHGLPAHEAPHYLTFNPFITGGYRNNLTPIDCIKSLFWWTNETLNIWSHLLGWVFFFMLTVYDVFGFSTKPKTHPWDQPIFSLLLVCFQACMFLSAGYHVFCCCSEKSYRRWLSMDLLGVSLSLLAIYISGIYYAFSCVPFWLNFYLSTVAAIFVCCLTCTFLRRSDGFSHRLLLFGGWACYGIVPTLHWVISQGGWKSPAVSLLFPRIIWMYVISAVAFFFYVSKLPERWKPGLVNYIGSSHQIWHVLIVAALYHWHNTGLLYLDYRSQHSCSSENPTLMHITI